MTLAAPVALATLAPGPDPISGTVNTPQFLSSGTGTVSAAGTLATGGSVSVTVNGSSTLNNLGHIQSDTARAIRLNTDSVTLTINNGSSVNSTALIESGGDDAFQGNLAGDIVTVNNYGTFHGTNGQGIDCAAITTGSFMLNNFSTGSVTATGSDALRPGVNGTVSNAGIIRATPVVPPGGSSPGSDGIDTQTNTGVQVSNFGTIEGRAGIAGGVTVPGTFAISVTNNSGGTISGVNGSGINIDGVANTVVATVVNNAGGMIDGTWDGVSVNGDGDGIDVDGVLNLTNLGSIRALGANGNGSDGFANGPDGVAAGGGTIINEAGAEIYSKINAGNATSGFGILMDNSSKGNAIAPTSVTNRGLIFSNNGPAIVFISTFANSIVNEGNISGNGLAGVGAAIQSGNGNDTIINRGNGDIHATTNDFAIDMQDGDDALSIEGEPQIEGRIDGGSGTNSFTVSPGAGKRFSYNGKISNFSSVQINAGITEFNGASDYTGNTTISGGTLNVYNFGGSATGTGSVVVQSSGSLGGSGTVGAVTLQSGGNITPNDGVTNSLHTGAVTFVSGSNFNVVLDGTTAATQYDQLLATGNVALAGATLNVTLGFTPALGNSFTIVQATGAISGTFAGLADGAQLTVSGSTFTIHYTATQVTLTTADPTPAPTPTPTATPVPTATPTPTAAPTATPTPNATPTPTPSATPARPLNISTRLRVQTGENVLIGGFIITGPANTTKKVMIRGLGPSLVEQNVPAALVLTDPFLELHGDAIATVTNDDWQQGDVSQIPPGFEPHSVKESVIVSTLPIGAQGISNYTAILKGANGEVGVGLAEIYDLDSSSAPSQLANISTRGFVQGGDNVMIGGFILGGSTSSSNVLIRVLGPSLASGGVQTTLPDPTLEVRDANGALVGSNDNWKTDDTTGASQEAEIRATGIPPDNDLECAILHPFAPGNYTAIVAGKATAEGVALVEIYNLK